MHIVKSPLANSAIYAGTVRHRRFAPRHHEFNYPLYMLALDLDEQAQIQAMLGKHRLSPLRWQRGDYLRDRPEHDLKAAAQAKIQELGGAAQIDRITLLCQVRCFGLYFSPINAFFAYEGDVARYLLAEVSNTPWGEVHYYLVDLTSPQATPKVFHVSPFMSLDMHYRWQIEPPAAGLRIHIENWRDELLFDATLSLRRKPIDSASIKTLLKTWPMMTLSVVKGIYWQALKLFAKGIPFHNHPGRT